MVVTSLWVLGCRGPEPDPAPAPVVARCASDPEVHVEALDAVPTGSSQARLDVALSAAADVAVACALDDDPAEVHLLEGSGAAAYGFRLGGLLADSGYTCTAAAVCPTSRTPPVVAALHTDGAPPGTPTATAESDPVLRMTGAYTLTNAQPDCTGGPDRDQWLVIWDPLGRPRWTLPLPPGLDMGIEARWHGDDTLVWGGGSLPIGSPTRVDLFDGVVYQTAFPGSEAITFHHDGKQLADGRMLTTEETLEHDWASFQVRITDPATESVDWYYHSDEAVAEGALDPAGGYDPVDPWHLNWADLVGDTVVMSLCHAHLIVGVDLASHEVAWRFGAGADFALVDAAGATLGAEHFPQCQHGLEFDGEALLVYDNGSELGYSRATEYQLDLTSRVATKTWEWTEPGWWERSLGDVDWLTADHQRVLVTEGHPECFSPSRAWVSQIVEVDKASGAAVHRLVFDEPETSSYRAERIDGCEIFANTAHCPELAERLAVLRPLLEP